MTALAVNQLFFSIPRTKSNDNHNTYLLSGNFN